MNIASARFSTLRSLAVTLFLLLIITHAPARSIGALPRSTPEKQGVSSRGLLQFVEAMDKSGMEFHSIMIVRHGKVITEGWWKPYAPALKHTLYSVSKSFTSTAIGFAVSEKRLTVNDKVISFFPADLPDTISPNLAALTVKDLLTMSAGQEKDPAVTPKIRETNWVKAFLSVPIVNTPGSKFLYNSLGTYMLSAIIQKVTGQKVIDYLTPRLFAPLHIMGIDWEVDPRGTNTGGWGLRVKTEDMAKFGQLYLQRGMWEGKQILPKEWIDEATTQKILQSPAMPQAERDTSDWQQGYCYQFWRCRHNAFRGDGAFGQLIVVLPGEDAVVVVTAETTDMQAELNLVWKHLLPVLRKNIAAEDVNAADALKLRKKLISLSLPLPKSGTAENRAKAVNGKTFTLAPNEKGFRTMSFGFSNRQCHVVIRTDTAVYPLTFGEGKRISGTTTKPGPDLLNAKANFFGLPPLKIAGSSRWTDASTLELTLRYIESPHTETYTCAFTDSTIALTVQKSIDRGKSKLPLTGH
jgi:CubicO group peptidase (beta-lactamase class C family)